jgi:hypothetical protein
VLRRRQAVATARETVARYEMLLRTMIQLIQGAASGLTQLEVDRCDEALQQARGRLAAELTGYRDRLDELKVELGLSPDAPVVPDRSSLKVFLDVFEAAELWFRNPKRDLAEVPALARRLPELDDVVLEFVAGHSLRAAIQNSDLLHPVMIAAEQAAVRNRNPKLSDADLRLSVRRSLRRLWDTTTAYRMEQTKLVLTMRMKDQAFARLLAPNPQDSGPVHASVRDLLAQETLLAESEDRLVALWTTFQAERLALYRLLGTFPYNDWASFYAHFRAERGDGGNDPRQVQRVGDVPVPPPAAPAPVAPAPPAPPPAPRAKR